MRIALLTIWQVGNYGAEMQTYATVKALQALGHEVVVIDYRLNEPCGFRGYIKSVLLSITPAILKFKHFWWSNIPSTKHYRTSEELHSNLPLADLYLVGSDQVWNPSITKDKYMDFFLGFLPDGVRRISYASSIGVSEWTFGKNITGQIAEQLCKFERVSCREEDGVRLLSKVFGIKAVNVLDPTMLFSGYPELIGKISLKETFVYYPLFEDKYMENFCREIAQMLNLKYINNNYRTYWLKGHTWNRPSVKEWIRNFAEAKFIVTQSFHGTVFSIIHHKQFFTIYNGPKVSRIENLLKILGISNRLFPNIESAREARPWEIHIDYMEVDKRLNKLREFSWNFLRNL